MMNIDSIPNEILQQIFIHLSHRHRAQCSLVNKKWYSITRQPLFYKTIRIYNKTQLKKFIHMASTFYLHNHLVGYYVERLLLGSYCIGWNNCIDNIPFEELSTICPNVIYTYTLASACVQRFFNFSLWPNLQTLPSWLQKRDKEWHQRVCNKNSTYTSLAFEIDNDIMTQGSYNHHHTTAAISVEEENEKERDTAFILFEKDKHKALRKLVDYPLAKRSGVHDIEIINNEHHVNYTGTVLSFTPKIKSNFLHLKELSIHFSQDFFSDITQRMPTIMEIDERTLEYIHQTCPVLESLTLQRLFMNVSNQYLQNKTILPSSPSVINACTSLKKLTLFEINFQHPTGCFHYFSKKYPQLTTLNMNMITTWTDSQCIEFKRKYKAALIDMITPYLGLTSFSVYMVRKLYEALENVLHWKKTFWSNTKFLKWLRQHPTQLTYLAYPFAFHAIEDDCDFGIIYQYKDYPTIYLEKSIIIDISKEEEEEIKQHYIYLDHLKELLLPLEYDLPSTYQYFSLIKKRHYTSFSNLISLHIDYKFLLYRTKKRYGTFYFYSWLKLFPHLKKLQLENIQQLDWDSTWDTMDDSLEYAGDMIYMEERMTNHGNINNYSQSNKLLRMKHQQQGPFPLEELILTNCNINGIYGLTHIGQACPSLRVLKLKHTVLVQHQEEMNEEDVTKIQLSNQGFRLDYDVVIDMSHLGLDELVIDQCVFHDLYTFSRYAPWELVIHEANNNTSFALSTEFDRPNNTTIVFICKYVDSVYFS